MNLTFHALLALSVSLTITAGACKKQPTPSQSTTSATTSSAKTNQAPKALVAKVVFIGQKESCNCTRTRIDDSLHALEQALAGHADVKIEKLRVDEDVAQVSTYRSMKPIMVIPAIYLLDGDGKLIEMLQGQVTAAQVRKVIGEPTSTQPKKPTTKKPLAG